MLSSPAFRGSKRCHDFLAYVVGQVLKGEANNLKERNLAIEVFGRNEGADLGDSSVVRVGAREVRKRLAQYYISQGAEDGLRIDLPSGSYVPVFQHRSSPAAALLEESPELPETAPLETPLHASRKRSAKWLVLLLAVAIAAAGAFWAGRVFYRSQSAFEAFWQPAFNEKLPLEILMAHPIAYHPSSRASQLDRDLNGNPEAPVQRAIKVPPKMLDGSDFVPVTDQYVGFGDAVAATRLATVFAQHHLSSRLKLASRVEFNDLVGSNVVLIGAFTNRWTGELTKDARFRFVWRNGQPTIVDAQTGKSWMVEKRDSGESAEDYIVLSRMPHSKTNNLVVVCAGLNYYGTEEAGRILAEPELLNPILKKLPPGWAQKNLQLLLHVEVIGDAPALPELVASYTW